MTPTPPHNPSSPLDYEAHGELAALLNAWSDGSLDAAAQSKLESLLRASDDAADFAAAWLDQHAALATVNMPPALAKPDPTPPRAKVRVGRPSFAIRHSALAIAAALLLAATAVVIYVLVFNSKLETRNSKPETPVATVTDTTGGNLAVNDAILSAGDTIRTGPITLDTGSAEFHLHNGVSVQLRGDTRLTVHGPMSATLARGTATFDCPAHVKGYTVFLPDGMRVVDLGTRFSVELLPDGVRRVTVLQGVVELHRRDPRGGDAPLRLAEGRSVRVDDSGLIEGPAPSVRFAGVDRATHGQLRSPARPKPLDPDGDNIYGSAGYALFNATPVGTGGHHEPPDANLLARWPDFVAAGSFRPAPGVVSTSYHGHLDADDPTRADPDAAPRLNVGLIGQVRAGAEFHEAAILAFTLATPIPDGGFRLGVLLDASPESRVQPTELVIRVADQFIAHAIPSPDAANGDGDVYLFDITHARPGDRVEISASGDGFAVIHALLFDPLPEGRTAEPTSNAADPAPAAP